MRSINICSAQHLPRCMRHAKPLGCPAPSHTLLAHLVKGMMNLPRISTLNTSWQSFCIAAQAAGGEGGRLSPDGADTTVPTVPLADTAAG